MHKWEGGGGGGGGGGQPKPREHCNYGNFMIVQLTNIIYQILFENGFQQDSP